MRKLLLWLLPLGIMLSSFTLRKPDADMLFYNAKIYTVNASFDKAEALAVKDGKIILTGTAEELRDKFNFAKEINLKGKYVYPGFIDAHSHFLGLGAVQLELDLRGAKSWEEVIKRCVEFYQKNKTINVLKGRGWDQNEWTNKQFPVNTELNRLFPGIPVLLKRVDGHAAIVNEYALQKTGLNTLTKIDGGELIKANGKLTGLLIDNAVDEVENNKQLFPDKQNDQLQQELDTAQKICLSKGLTSVCDAGITSLQAEFLKNAEHDIRIYAMLSINEENISRYMGQPYKTANLNISSFKMYADGSLGSRGACLLNDYSDQKNHRGFLLTPLDKMEEYVMRLSQSPFQLNTHCIGDSANRLILQMYSKHLAPGNNNRWRIEHAQVVNESDMDLFRMYNIIPSVQPTHATSDMGWAEKRLGRNRINDAYAYRKLLDRTRILALGTDFPVEDANPLHTFYAAVSRKDAEGKPIGGFLPSQALTREEALKGITIWAAFSAFEETEKGTLEAGKFADFVVLDADLLNDDLLKIRNAKVISTYINGKLVYSGK